MLRRVGTVFVLSLSLAGCSQETASEPVASTQGELSTTTTTQAAEPPAPPAPEPPDEAFDACKSLAEGAECSVSLKERALEGSCRKGPDGSAPLACAPAKMPPPPPMHKPPQQAFDACKSAAEGAACSVKLRDKTVDGMCRKGPDASAALACAPSKMPPPPPPGMQGPPQEALDACKSLAENATCSMQFGDKTIGGSCRNGPDGKGALACAPSKMPPPPPPGMQGPPQEALDACKSLAEGATCSVKLPARALDGTCRKGPDSSKPLACAPAHMPPPGPPPALAR